MQLRDRLRAGTASFAHLAGLGRAPLAARAEDETDDERKEREDKEQAERDDDYARKEAAGEDTGEDDDEKKDREARRKARGIKADDDDPEKDAEDDDGDDDGDKKEMRSRSPLASARARERGRCAAIFMSRHAAANPAMAAELAFNTRLSRKEAVAVLAAAPVSSARGERANRNPQLGPGGEAQPSSSQAIASSWDRAFTKTLNRSGRRSA